VTVSRSLADVLADADLAARSGQRYSPTPWPTGFHPLDDELGGGLRAGELVLIGGPQGLGKTTFTLQMARNIVATGGKVLYLCYEHDERSLLLRLIALEAGLLAGDDEPPSQREIADALRADTQSSDGMLGRLDTVPLAAAAFHRLTQYGDRLRLVTASGRSTGIDQIRDLVRSIAGDGVVFVDYLQKVAVRGIDNLGEDERVTVVVEGLKDAALDFAVPIVAIAAADKPGIADGRTRLHQLRGSTALAYECDIALMLNDKWHIVARHHLMFGTTNADRFHDWVVCTVEKNRAGRADVDLEFMKRFREARFDADGGYVVEELVDDRVFRE
jgi:replicative DNA helicase